MPIDVINSDTEKKEPIKRSKLIPGIGLYHFHIKEDSAESRVHLRIDPDGRGLLMINASKVVQLNPTAAILAYCFLNKVPPQKAVTLLAKEYRITRKKLRNDVADTYLKIEELLKKDGACPVCDLNLDITAPFSARPTAPYRMDLAITYRCNNACHHCYNARPRNYAEMATSEWKQVIDRLWDLSIPHLVFTGGEPTLRDDLPELIAYAENKGQITGINTNGRRLADKGYLDALVNAGLDHVQITFESHIASIHDEMVAFKGAYAETLAGLRNVVATRLYMMTNTTLLTNNHQYLRETLNFLADQGVPTIGLNALIYAGRGANVNSGLMETELPPLLDIAREVTSARNVRLIWYTPTQYCHFNPLQMQLGIKGCTAALYNMCVEPDGAVLPCQSYYESLGNILTDPWESIWQNPLAVSIRERKDIPEGCRICDLLAECGGGCPLAREHQSIEPIIQNIFS